MSEPKLPSIYRLVSLETVDSTNDEAKRLAGEGEEKTPEGTIVWAKEQTAGDDKICVNSAGDWGPSKPTAVPDFIMAMRGRGHSEATIRKVVYENPIQFFQQSQNFAFTPPEAETATV